MSQKISYFHSFAIDISGAGKSRVSHRGRKKSLFGDLGTAHGGEREGVRAGSLQQHMESILAFGPFPGLTWGVGAATRPPGPSPLCL